VAGEPDAIAAATELRRRWLVPTLFTVDASDDATLGRLALAESAGLVLRPFAERELRVGLDLALRAGGACRAASEAVAVGANWLSNFGIARWNTSK